MQLPEVQHGELTRWIRQRQSRRSLAPMFPTRQASIKRKSTIRSLNTELASSPSLSNPNKSVEEIMMMFDSLRWSGAKHVLWCDQERLCPMCDLVSKIRFLCLMQYVSRSMWIYVKRLFFCAWCNICQNMKNMLWSIFLFPKQGYNQKEVKIVRAKSQG
jgi:hypothetical protein